MKRVVIDVNSAIPYYVRGWASGIGNTTISLVSALDKIDNLPFEILLYSQNTKGVSAKRMGTRFPYRHLYYPYREKWNHALSKTPIRELLTGYDLYHIPHNFDWVHCADRTLITLHDALCFSYPEAELDHTFARKHYPKLAKKCRGIITCSESSKREIIQYMDIPEKKIDVCYWGIDNTLFHPADTKDQPLYNQPYFLAVSCSRGRKNTPMLLRAYEKFARQNPSHYLVVVGAKTISSNTLLQTNLSISKRVVFLNDVSEQTLVNLYQHATATFFPSRHEGFGLPVLESMACGTPVVTCPNSSLPEVGGDAALYIDPDDMDGMASLMEHFENGDYDRSTLQERCLSQSAKFSPEHCAQQTIGIYEKYL